MTDSRMKKYKLINEYDEKLKEYRCYSERMNWICFSGFGKNEQEAELNYHIAMSKILINRPKIFSDIGA